MSELKKILESVQIGWLKLGNITQIKTGRNISKHYISQNPGIYAVINSGKEPLGYVNEWNTENDPIGITSRGAGVGSITWQDGKYFRGNLNYSVTINNIKFLDIRYLYNILIKLQPEIKSLCTYDGIPALNAGNLVNLKIPIPYPDNPEKSLKIQEEIVRILDSLSEETNQVTAALQKELVLHQKQYNFYREELFAKKYKLSRLGDPEVGKFIRGGGLQKKDFTSSGVGCIHYGQVYTHYGIFAYETKSFVSEHFAVKARKAKTGDLVIATTSENDDDVCKAVAWLGNDDIAVSSDACFFRHNLDPKYVSYYFQTEQFQKQKRKYITGIKVRRVNADDLAKISIPVPSSEEQEIIIKILDDLNEKTQAITEAIQKEIALRSKQYEYYRDRLLSFHSLQNEVEALQ